jgi:hypothetical protein
VRAGVLVGAVLAALAVNPLTASAQTDPQSVREVAIGSRIRVAAPSIRRERFVGKIEAFPPDSIQMDTSGARRKLGFDTGPVLVDEFRKVTIPLSAVRQLEISGGTTRMRSTLVFGGIGAGVGALAFGAAGLPEVNPTFKDFVGGLGQGFVVGGIVGGVIGYLWGGERWLPASWPRIFPPRGIRDGIRRR